MRKTAFAAFVITVFICLITFTSHAASTEITVNGQVGVNISFGDVLGIRSDDIPADRIIQWYAGDEMIGSTSDTITVTADMLGKDVSAHIIYDGNEIVAGPVSVQAVKPTIEFSGNAGDYSAYLTWSGDGNGSPISRYEITYSLAVTPDVIINKFEYGPETTGCTLNGLSGGNEHVIKLTAFNSAGSTSYTIRLTPNDPDLATVTAVKNEIESSGMTLHMNLANTKESVKEYLLSYLSRYSSYEVNISEVIVSDFVAASKKTQDQPDAPNGSFTFIVEITKGDVRMTTKKISAQIDNSSSVVYLSSQKFSVIKNETVEITALKIDIPEDIYEWFIADSASDNGTRIEGVDGSVLSMKTDRSGEFYVYCVCGGVSSSKMKITVSEPFSAVSDIVLYTDSVFVGESSMLQYEVIPADATNKTVMWSIENDGNCSAQLNGRTMTANQPGTVTLKAKVSDGTADGSFEKIFYVTVKRRTETETENNEDTDNIKDVIYTAELDCSKISGIDAITVKAEGGDIQITSVTDSTVSEILQRADIYAESKDIIGAVKFVYGDGAIVHESSIRLKGYDNKRVKILTVNGNGGISLTDQEPENGVVSGNAVSPDTVILLKESAGVKRVKILPYIILIIVPAVIAVAASVYVFSASNKSKKKKRKSKS